LQEIDDNFTKNRQSKEEKSEKKNIHINPMQTHLLQKVSEIFYVSAKLIMKICRIMKMKAICPFLAWEEEDSSSSNNSEDSNGSFTTDLTDVFHSCKRRLQFLDEIERSFYLKPTIVGEKPSNVAILSEKLNASLKSIFGSRISQSHVLKEIVAAGHQ
jgi:hypothetical protein